tara:strand:- start:1546 stop:3258 length:1713 start_codon:yes stop_codon:yes gene_type:complete
VASERSALETIKDGLSIINAQQEMAAAGAATGNPRTKGVVVDSKSGSKANKAKAVSATLTSNEKSRYENIFKILKDVIDPDPEAGKSSTTSRAKKEASVSDPAKVAAGGDAEKEGSSFIDKLLGGLGIMGFAKRIFGFLKKKLFSLLKRMGKFLKDALKRGLKAAKNLLKSVGKAALKQLKRLGRWAGKLFTGLMNSKPMMAFKGAISAAFTRLKDVFMGAKNALMKHVGKLKNLIKPAATAATGAGVGGAAAAAAPRPSTPRPSAFSRFKSFVGGGLKKAGGAIGKTVDAGKYVAKKTMDAGKYVAKKTGQGIKAVKNLPGALLSKAKVTATGAMKTVLKGGKGVLRVLGKFAKLPIIGPVIEGFLIKGDLEKLQEQAAAGEITPEELEEKAGRRVMTGVTAIGGAALGGIAGSLIPIPIIGTLAGAVTGDLLGRLVGGVIADTLLDPYKRDVGRFALNRMGSVPVVNDGIITHGGQTVRINSKDDVLALKTGGPLDKLMKPSSLDIGSAQVFDDMRELGKAQLQTLVAIKNGINALVAKGGQKPSGPMEINLQRNKLSDMFHKNELLT